MRVLIVWGSETNNTQGFVNKIRDSWKDKHGDQLKTLDVFQGDEIADEEKWETVTKDNYDFVLIATSSYEEGEPPSGFGRFLYRLQEASKEGEGSGSSQLKGLSHAVLGIGSTCYDTFQNCPRHVDKYLEEAGSRRIKERFEWDEMEHTDDDVYEWGDTIYKVMTAAADGSDNKKDVCSWKEPKDELLSKIVGEDGYEVGEGPGEGFTSQQKLVIAVLILGIGAVYYYQNYVVAGGDAAGEAVEAVTEEL